MLASIISELFVSDEPSVSVSLLQEINAIAEIAIAVNNWYFMMFFLSVMLLLNLFFSRVERLVEVFAGFGDVLGIAEERNVLFFNICQQLIVDEAV